MTSPDSEDLEALFDSVVAECTAAPGVAPAAPAASATSQAPGPVELQPDADGSVPTDVFHRVGMLTRTLHDALRELGYDKGIESARRSLPDARDRLDYIASLTGRAAERTLGAVERAREHQDMISAGAQRLGAAWQEAFAGCMSPDAIRGVASDTRAFLDELADTAGATNGELTEIMMAQDFHDLTGQVIARIVKIARDIETQLVALLVEVTPPELRPASEEGCLTGPAMRAGERSDVVTSQAQVDDLLESLGF